MTFFTIIIGLLSGIFLFLLGFNFLIVLPEYYACKDFFENETASTIWGSVDCIGDTAEFSLVFFRMICVVLILLLLIIISMVIIYRKQKGNRIA